MISPRPALRPIQDDDLSVLEALAASSPTEAEGWSIIARRPPKQGAPALQLWYRKFSGKGADGSSSSAELRVELELPVAAGVAFEELYGCAFLAAVFPWWAFQVSIRPTESGGSDLVQISCDRLDMLCWRRCQHGRSGSTVWLLHPAEQQEAWARLKRSSVVEIFGINKTIFGCHIQPQGSAASRILLYMRIPGSGMLLRTSLASLLPGPVKRIARRLLAVGSAEASMVTAQATRNVEEVRETEPRLERDSGGSLDVEQFSEQRSEEGEIAECRAVEYDYNQASYCIASEVSEQEVISLADLEAWDFVSDVSQQEVHEVASEHDLDEAEAVAELNDDVPHDRLPLVDDNYRDMAGEDALTQGASYMCGDESLTKAPSDVEVLSNASMRSHAANDRTERPARCEGCSGVSCVESGLQHPEVSKEFPAVPVEPHIEAVAERRDAPLAFPLPPLDQTCEEMLAPCDAMMLNGAVTPEEFLPSAADIFGCPIAQPKRPRRKPWPTMGGRGFASSRKHHSTGTWV